MTASESKQPRIFYERFPVGPLQCNCVVMGDRVTKKALVIDPGGDTEKILGILRRESLTLTQIIHTHAHLDHILASGVLKEQTGAALYLHKGDRFLWDAVEQQCKMFGVPVTSLPDPDFELVDEQDLHCGNGVCLHTPGHTPGSVSFWFEDEKLLVAGDTLFRRGVGRTDLPGGSFEELQKSIAERLFSLDDSATVITGHGPDTTLAEEMSENPFVRA